VSVKTERLVNLTVALLATQRPQTFQQLRERMGEWQEGDAQSQRRKFERDKDELRRLGVPIDTVTTGAFGGEAAYVIDPARYELPDVSLTVQQMTVLAVAFQLVEGGADQLTFSKVAARAPDPDHLGGPESPTGITVRAADVELIAPLATAIVERRVVRFTHRKTTGERTAREVEPYALLSRRGTWYLQGFDRTRHDHRMFRTDRIEGEIQLTDEPMTIDLGTVDASHALTVFELPDEIELTLAVRTSEGWQQQRRRDRWFRATSRALSGTPDVVIIDPPDAHAAVLAGLHAVLEAHTGEVSA
jgi:proteasome accessory factor B